jgi:hypothetical protein
VTTLLADIYLPSDIRASQAALLARAIGTDASIQQCAGLDATTRSSWGDFYIQLVDFCSDTSWSDTFFSFHRGSRFEELQTELHAWQEKLKDVCALATPAYDPDNPPDSQGMRIIKYAFIATLVVAGAYGVGKLVELVEVAVPRKALPEKRT